MPMHIVFWDQEKFDFWKVFLYACDLFVMFDMILNFFTPITSECGKVEITDKKKIAMNYLKSWFLVDMLSIIPYEVFLNGNKRYNILARSSRLFKISKLIRLARLVKGLKKLNGAKALDANFSAMMQINSG